MQRAGPTHCADLPWPVSVNATKALRRRGGKYSIGKSDRARQWANEAQHILANSKERPPKPLPRAFVTIAAHPKTKRRFDLGNLDKVVMDSLVQGLWIEDDESGRIPHQEQLHSEDHAPKGMIRVYVTEVSEGVPAPRFTPGANQ